MSVAHTHTHKHTLNIYLVSKLRAAVLILRATLQRWSLGGNLFRLLGLVLVHFLYR